MIHQIKIYPKFFKRVESGEKNFEVRINDRDYQKGDTLVLHEWDPEKGKHTDNTLRARCGYLLHGTGSNGITPGYVVIQLTGVGKN